MIRKHLAPLALAALGGCADPIRAESPDAAPADGDPGGDGPLTPAGPVTTAAHGDGTYTTLVDATSKTAWVHVDLDARAATDAAGPWDLRFQRFHISANGGASGTGGVEVAPLAGRALADVTAAPAAGWITDAADGPDENLDPEYALGQGDGWYAYDPATHVLTPRPMVWVVRTSEGGAIKLAIERYYDAAGTPGWLSFRWGAL